MLPCVRDKLVPMQNTLKGGTVITKKDGTTRKKPMFTWTDDMEQAFVDIQRMLANQLMLYHPDPTKPFVLFTDASNVASGAALFQNDDDMELQPVAFYSRTFTAAQRNYSTQHRELLAILQALRRSRNLLIGGAEVVTYTDHQANANLLTTRTSTDSARICRWREEMQQYNLRILWRPGVQMHFADWLSRPTGVSARQWITERETWPLIPPPDFNQDGSGWAPTPGDPGLYM
ncbi:MAG: Ty3/Gypsy family RNase HI domain-containing protein, partial [Gemmatimonadota bacterium]